MKIMIEQDGFVHSYEWPESDEKITAEETLYRTICLLGSVYTRDELIKAWSEMSPAEVL